MIELIEIDNPDYKKPKRVVAYIRVGNAKQWDMKKLITKHTPLQTAIAWNSQEFYATADKETRQKYENKIAKLLARIKVGVKTVPAIMAEAVAEQPLQTHRERICGCIAPMKVDAEWCAIAIILKSLIDIKTAKA